MKKNLTSMIAVVIGMIMTAFTGNAQTAILGNALYHHDDVATNEIKKNGATVVLFSHLTEDNSVYDQHFNDKISAVDYVTAMYRADGANIAAGMPPVLNPSTAETMPAILTSQHFSDQITVNDMLPFYDSIYNTRELYGKIDWKKQALRDIPADCKFGGILDENQKPYAYFKVGDVNGAGCCMNVCYGIAKKLVFASVPVIPNLGNTISGSSQQTFTSPDGKTVFNNFNIIANSGNSTVTTPTTTAGVTGQTVQFGPLPRNNAPTQSQTTSYQDQSVSDPNHYYCPDHGMVDQNHHCGRGWAFLGGVVTGYVGGKILDYYSNPQQQPQQQHQTVIVQNPGKYITNLYGAGGWTTNGTTVVTPPVDPPTGPGDDIPNNGRVEDIVGGIVKSLSGNGSNNTVRSAGGFGALVRK